MVRPNADYGMRPRSHVSDGTRRRDLDAERLARVRDPTCAWRCGCRRRSGCAGSKRSSSPLRGTTGGDRIGLKGAATKGGRPREVPVLQEAQREVLDEARELVRGGALIPPGRNYAEQKRVYEAETRKAGLDRNHGLRHAYALDRYECLTGWKAAARRRAAAAGADNGTEASTPRPGWP